MGSIRGEWNACDVLSARHSTPWALKRSTSVSTSCCRPAMTVSSGPLMAAMDTLRAWPASTCATFSWRASTATILPVSGRACMSRPRAATSLSASSRLNTPASQAATYSPRLWPMTAAGLTPHSIHTCASAYSSAKSAGWVTLACSRSAPLSP